MPVITHRRASEMRTSRRRLSASAVGGYPGFVPITTGSNSNLLRGEGHAFVVNRQVSSPTKRPIAIPKLSHSDRDTEILSSAGTSPTLVHMVTDSSQIHVRDLSESPPFPPLKDRKITSPDKDVAILAKYQMESSNSTFPVLAESDEASQMDDDKDMEYEQSHCAVIGSPKASDNRDIPDLSGSSTNNGNIMDECSDDDLRYEPLPSTEQLILSQSWSTWPIPCHDLYSGSQFSGSQSNGTRSYRVTVSFQYVDMGVPELCGHFTIRGLTTELPELTTYFDAQIVGTGSHSFITNQWDASVDTDRTHWSFFPAFRQYRNKFDCKDFRYKLSLSDQYVFMRWKERFVVPNYKLSRINGASYDGFYYVCYDREDGSIAGYYYHKESDQYQCLKLTHVKQQTFAHFELA